MAERRPMLSKLFSTGPRHLSFIIFFVLACLITAGLERVAENAIQSGGARDPGLAPSVFELSGIYQRVVASGPRKPAPTFTVIVPIDPRRTRVFTTFVRRESSSRR